ncbi:cytochrome b5-like heme/steroid binding domain-containing protein [Paradesulfitobacterium aromaticivorans]
MTNSKLWKLGKHTPMGQQLVAGQDLTGLLEKAPPNHQTPEFWGKISKVGTLKSTQ